MADPTVPPTNPNLTAIMIPSVAPPQPLAPPPVPPSLINPISPQIIGQLQPQPPPAPVPGQQLQQQQVLVQPQPLSQPVLGPPLVQIPPEQAGPPPKEPEQPPNPPIAASDGPQPSSTKPAFSYEGVSGGLSWLLSQERLQLALMEERWLVVFRRSFDLYNGDQPYRVIEFMLELDTGRFLSRVWNTTVQEGTVTSVSALGEALTEAFQGTAPCPGLAPPLPSRRTPQIHITELPFKRAQAKDCLRTVRGSSSSCSKCHDLQQRRSRVKEEPTDSAGEERDLDDEGEDENEDEEYMVHDEGENDYEEDDLDYIPPPVKEEEEGVPVEAEVVLKEGAEVEDEDDWRPEKKRAAAAANRRGRKPRAAANTAAKPKPSQPAVTKCKWCDFEGNKVALSRHEQFTHLKGPFRCDYCAEQYETIPVLLEHTSSEHPEAKVLVCPYCRTHVPKEDDFTEHYKGCMARSVNEPNFKRRHLGREHCKCMTCGKEFKQWHLLRVHYRWHKGQRDIKCDECDFKTFSESALTTHKKSHKREKGELPSSYFCELCGKSFSLAFSLKYHIEYVHENKSDNIKCDKCGKHFNRYKRYQQHCHKEHSDDPRFACKVCGKRYMNMTKVRRCEESHAGIFEYNCNICGKGMKRKRNYEDHMRIHTGERPYHCKLCSYSAKSSTALYIHNRGVHKGQTAVPLKEEVVTQPSPAGTPM